MSDKMSRAKLSHKNMVSWSPSSTYRDRNYPDYRFGLQIRISDPDYRSGLRIRIMKPDYGSGLCDNFSRDILSDIRVIPYQLNQRWKWSSQNLMKIGWMRDIYEKLSWPIFFYFWLLVSEIQGVQVWVFGKSSNIWLFVTFLFVKILSWNQRHITHKT